MSPHRAKKTLGWIMGSVYKSLSWDKLNPFVFCWSANTPRKLDMCQSKESDFTLAADSTAGHLFLSPLVFSCCGAYQLESTTEFPPLQGFQQSLAVVSPLQPPLESPLGCAVLCLEGWVWLTMFHPGSSSCIFHDNLHTVIFFTPVIFP